MAFTALLSISTFARSQLRFMTTPSRGVLLLDRLINCGLMAHRGSGVPEGQG